ASAIASASLSGRARAASRAGVRRTMASPRSCSACISALRRVLDGRRSLGESASSDAASLGGAWCAWSVGLANLRTGLRSSCPGRRGVSSDGRMRPACQAGGVCYHNRFEQRPRFQSPSMTVPATRFPLASDALAAVASDLLREAKAAGATAAETEVSQGFGQSVTVRKGDVETIAYNRDKGIGVTVYVGARRGHASTADFAPAALKDTVTKAITIARYTADDACAGLADPALLARAWADLDLYHPWDLSVEEAIALGRECEAAALGVDRRLTNSEGVTISLHEAQFVYANSNGFTGGYASSRHGIYCAVIGEEDGAMQRDDWYSTARSPADLESVSEVGRQAGLRTVRRLGARQLATMDCPVLYEAPIASGLIGHFVSAVSGGSLYRKSSFLIDSLGAQVFTPAITIREEPHLKRGAASAPFDDEGVATQPRDVVRDGVVQGYFLGSY